MGRSAFLILSLLSAICLLGPLLPAQTEGGSSFRPSESFSLQPASRLSILGTTNVRDFECHCRQGFAPTSMNMRLDASGQRVLFSETFIKVQTERLDCGGRGINRDLHKALKSDDYPSFTIELLEASFDQEALDRLPAGQLVTMKAVARITLAGVHKVLPLNVEVSQNLNGSYQLVSTEMLKMTSFGIEPPRPLLGLIQVDDDIRIVLDLSVKLNQAQL